MNQDLQPETIRWMGQAETAKFIFELKEQSRRNQNAKVAGSRNGVAPVSQSQESTVLTLGL
jgi:hypothetical protein